jgi:nitrite reductase/ring-hydroxylating ferredoxin subunit
VSSNQIIVRTHYPINDVDGLYFSRLHVERSYALAAKVKGDIPDGMYLSADQPTRSLRYATGPDGEKLLLIGGEGHPTGQNKRETACHYQKLAEFGSRYFQIEEFPYHWSSQDIFTLDKIPYAGPVQTGTDNIFTATGYAKWGMTNGTAAALVLKDYILNKDNKYNELFDPRRREINAGGVKSFVKENAVVAKELVKGKIKHKDRTIKDLREDEGGLVRVNGKKAGAYKDATGSCHLVHPVCTHMGCDVEWNDAERSWDCPCHASRFSYKGEVLEGPAAKALRRFKEQC